VIIVKGISCAHLRAGSPVALPRGAPRSVGMESSLFLAWCGPWVLVVGALLVGCKEHKSAGEAPSPAPTAAESAHADEPAHEEIPRRVHLAKEVIAAAKIKTAPVAREALETVIELPGEIAADPDRSARVAAPIAGTIERLSFTEGAAVKAHELLAVVRVADLADRHAAFAGATARAGAAAANAKRLDALAAEGIATERERVAAGAEASALDAEARASAERLRALGLGVTGKPGSLIELRAPIAGIVVMRDAVVGQSVGPDHPIATIVELGEVWFLGRVFENDLARVTAGAPAEVQLNAYPEERFNGPVELVGRQIDPIARTVTARIRLQNRGDLLRLGLFGTARIASDAAKKGAPSLVVPLRSVTEINGKPVVFVRHPDDDFELHPVVLGRAALGKIEVLSGLREGEEVVVEGAFTLKSLVLKSTFAEDE
jgi:cobalt-zinc-cadmium efflux system membrane fusion protein